MKRIGAMLLSLLLAATPLRAAETSGLEALHFRDLRQTDAALVTLAQLQPMPRILVFWRSDCAACQSELALLPEIARPQPQGAVALVVLEDSKAARGRLAAAKLPENITLLQSDADARAVLAAFGDTRSALPFSVALGKTGVACARHTGVLGTQTAHEWMRAC